MKFLIKLFCLLSLVSSFGFSENLTIYTDENLNGYKLKPYDIKFLKGNSLIGVRYVNYGSVNEYRVYRFRFDHDYYSGSKYSPGFYLSVGGSIYYFGGDVISNHLYVVMNSWSYTVYSISNDPNQPFLTYSSFLSFHTDGVVATCGVNQEFNTETNKCVDPCPAGHFWNVETNSCIFDCSDEDNHKFFTSDYKCIDCSSALTADDVARCYCTGLGSSYNPGYSWDPDKSNILHAHCANETEISFKFNKDKMKDKDNNSTNSSDKDKENPDKKDNNENSNNSSGESGNSSNNNSGGSSGNGSSGGGGSGVETKPNPNYKGDGKEDGKGDGKQDGKGEEGKGDDAVAGKLDYGDLEKDTNKFTGDYSKAIEDSFSFVNDVKNSLSDTISKIKDGNLMSLKKSAVPTTCPLNFQIDMTYFSKNLTFDFCKIVSPVSSSLYILFYLGFFVLFLLAVVKLFILTFMGW